MSHQKGFAHAFLIIGLVVALIGALGFIFWQNFIHKEPTPQDPQVVVYKSKDTKTGDDTKGEEDSAKHAPLTKAALSAALPEGCSLGNSDGTNNFDVSKLTKVTSSSPLRGPLDYGQYGRINQSHTWVYVNGGCSTSGGAFVLEDNSGTWKLVDYHTGDAWFMCSDVDGVGIPHEIVGLCIDDKTSKERAIR